MGNIQSIMQLGNVQLDGVKDFIEHWKNTNDLPCEDFNIEKIDGNLLHVELYYPRHF